MKNEDALEQIVQMPLDREVRSQWRKQGEKSWTS